MKIRTLLPVLLVFMLPAFFVFCKKKKSAEPEPDSSFDKPAMLANYADQLIVPNLRFCQAAITDAVAAFSAFEQNQTVQNLQALRVSYVNASVAFQHIATFEFGPSESAIVRGNFNIYPTDTSQINSNIASGSYNLDAIANLDAKGLPAVDFLLYGMGMSDNSVVAAFAGSASRLKYVKDCLIDMQSRINTVVNGWNSGYRDTFVSSTGSQIGSSLGLLLNQLDFEIDLLKNGKIGIPLGKKSLDVILPEKCEAYYAKTISVQLARECLTNLENVYRGRSRAGADGPGLDDYLSSLGAMHGTTSLDEAIKNQFSIARQKLTTLSEPLTAELVNNKAAVNDAYNELVKLLVLLKTDAPSALGIVITYQDGDGD